jgi:Asp-tRNA(Asn)/Glu-tRNA(Gln) amidotransferase A subunit family amidase
VKKPSGKEYKDFDSALRRRHFLGVSAAFGLIGTLFPGALAVIAAESEEVTPEMVAAAEQVAGLSFTDAERREIIKRLNSLRERYGSLRSVPIDNSVPPALVFNPVMADMRIPKGKGNPFRMRRAKVSKPASEVDLAFLPVTALSRLIETKAISSVELTRIYLTRLRKYDPALHCVVNLTEDLAIRQAGRADREIAAGKYRGLLHGIPWGVKDLFAVKGYPVTWGAEQYRDRALDYDSTVVSRLEAAGAVLLAKLSTGRFASGENWYGGRTRNPWNPEQGSSGSSAGPGASTAAGLVGFSIGTETRGSIAGPSERCGVSGLRPTYGRVSRYGAMALSWSMDKPGPLCRSAEDCAVVFNAICGPDDHDNSIADTPFGWDDAFDVKRLRVGYVPAEFEEGMESVEDRAKINHERYRAALDTVRGLGVKLIPISLPETPGGLAEFILSVEGAAAFDYRNAAMHPLAEGHGVAGYRVHRLVPAVEYLQANRLRTLLMGEMEKVMAGIDCYITPTFVGPTNGLTNLTGHPEMIVPCGYQEGGLQAAVSFVGRLFGEATILSLARAYQRKTDFHVKHPKMD